MQTITELSERELDQVECANCGAERPADQTYCGRCGEKQSSRINVRNLFGEMVRRFAQLDFTLIRTVRALCVRPGEMVRGYVEGRRQFTNPIVFAFLTATLYIALNNLVVTGAGRLFDPLVNYRALWPYLLFALLVPAVVLQRVLFRRSGFNFAEHYTFALYIGGALLLLQTALLPLKLASLGNWPLLMIYLFEAWYFGWALTRFVAKRGPAAWLGALIEFAAYTATILLVLWWLSRSVVTMLLD